MPFALKKSDSGRWWLRVVTTALLFSFLCLVGLAVFLSVLPRIVSTPWGQDLIRKTASEALGSAVQFDSARWSWREGLKLENLVIPDPPEFSPKPAVTIDTLSFAPDIRKALRREVDISVVISTASINIISNDQGVTNMEMLANRDGLPSGRPETEGEREKKAEDTPLSIPSFVKDIAFSFHLENFGLRYEDRSKEETYAIDNLEVELIIPSLKKEGLDFRLEMDLWANGRPIPRSMVTASINQPFTEDGHLDLDSMMAAAELRLPGLTARMHADLGRLEATGNFHLNLDAAMEAAAPFIPESVSGTTLGGDVQGNLFAGADPSDSVDFSLSVTGEDLTVSGKRVDEVTIGPGDVALNFSGSLDIPKERFELVEGDLRFLDKGRCKLKALAEGINSADPTVQLFVSDLFLDLHEVLSIAGPILPPAVDIVGSPSENAFFSMDTLRIEGALAKGPLDVKVKDLALQIPKAAYSDEKNQGLSLEVTDGRLGVETLTIQLVDQFPTAFELLCSVKVGQLGGVQGKDAFSASKMRMEAFRAHANELSKEDNSPFGIKGKVAFDQGVTIDRGEFGGMMRMDGFQQSLKGEALFSVDPPVRITLHTTELFGKSLAFADEALGSYQSQIGFNSDACRIVVKSLDPPDVDIRDFKMNANLEKAVSMSMSAEALHLPVPDIDLTLNLAADIAAVLEKLPPELRGGLSGNGDLTAKVSWTGRPPNPKETAGIEKLSLTGNLSFIDRLKLDMRVEKGSLNLPLTDDDRLEIRAINADPLVRYALDGSTGQGAFSSSVSALGTAISSSTKATRDFSARVSTSGEHDYLDRIDLRPSLTVSPTRTNASANVSIEGLHKIIGPEIVPELSDLLTTLGVNIAAVIDVSEPGRINEIGLQGVPSFDIGGPLETDLRLLLQPDRFIAGSLSIETRRMNFSMPERITMDRLDTDLNLSKHYAIVRSERNLPVEPVAQLSARVMELDGPAKPSPGNNPIQNHIRRMHERMNPDPTLSFHQADLLAGPFPLVIEDSVFMLNFDNGLPKLDFFQAHLLGGTLNGSLAMNNTPKGKLPAFFIDTSIYFSGIDMATIFPVAFSDAGDAETDITGMLHAKMPLSDQMRTILENSNLNIEFTKIGALALERLLYAIDPYENNEAIVTQRRLLRTGTPKDFKMDIKDGFLTLSGNVSVKGINIAMPKIRRLNIAMIPGMEQFEENLADLTPLIDMAKILSAAKIVVNNRDQTVSFR